MEAKELRINNYVKTDIHGIGIVSALSDLDLLYSRNYNSLPMKYIKPIPLTEEWLVWFGFEKALNGWWSDNELWSYKNGKFYLGANIYLSDATFVHQLQNLYFALNNEELIINLQ
jgi:hypothetical protein